jgi:hypothetical protein
MKVVEKTVGHYNKTTGEYIKNFSGQGYFYLDYDAFLNKTDEVCYIPELYDTHYTYIDFIRRKPIRFNTPPLCGGCN